MRIIYVTACMPYGTAEAFIIDELQQLVGTHQVLIVPRSPGAPGPHATRFVPLARREGLLSPNVLMTAIRLVAQMPLRILRSSSCLLQTRTLAVAARNLAILPKALWLSHLASEWKADHIHCHWAGTTATMTLVASR